MSVIIGNEKREIEIYYESINITPPWDMDPKVLTVAAKSSIGQQLLHASRTGSGLNLAAEPLGTGLSGPKTQSAASEGVIAGLRGSMAALQSKLEAMDSKFKRN